MVTQLLGCGAKPRDFFRVSDALFKANLTTKHAPWHTHKHTVWQISYLCLCASSAPGEQGHTNLCPCSPDRQTCVQTRGTQTRGTQVSRDEKKHSYV